MVIVEYTAQERINGKYYMVRSLYDCYYDEEIKRNVTKLVPCSKVILYEVSLEEKIKEMQKSPENIQNNPSYT